MRYITLFTILLALCSCHRNQPQQDGNLQSSGIGAAIDSRQYVFKARSASPVGGSVVQLTTDYWLKVSGDTVIAALPYFGRAYTAPIGGAGGGIEFTSTNVDYRAQKRRKQSWEIQMAPHDNRDVRTLFLTTTAGGYATLQVTSNNRQNISFSGVIEKLR